MSDTSPRPDQAAAARVAVYVCSRRLNQHGNKPARAAKPLLVSPPAVHVGNMTVTNLSYTVVYMS
jgi:hypothetical protein